FTMNYSLRDQAGNTTAAEARTILVDATGPTFSGAPVFPSTLTGGAAATFGIATIQDNVDLDAFDVNFVFGAAGTLPMGPWKVVGDGFAGDLVTKVTNQTYEVSHFVRSVQQTDASGAPAGAPIAPTAIRFRARDVAGNIAASTDFNFASGVVPAGEAAATYAPELTNLEVDVEDDSICDIEADGACGAVPQSTTVSAILTGTTGKLTNPYSRTWFFRVDQNTSEREFIGEATAANQEDDGSVRTFTYRITLNGKGLGVQNGMDMCAVAVTSDGDALVSRAVQIDIVPEAAHPLTGGPLDGPSANEEPPVVGLTARPGGSGFFDRRDPFPPERRGGRRRSAQREDRASPMRPPPSFQRQSS